MHPLSRLKNLSYRLARLLHTVRLRKLTAGQSQPYRDYLAGQLERTLLKARALPALQPHTRLLVDTTAEYVDLRQCDVLCIGCRNAAEIDYFRHKGARRVLGIDLLSVRHDILVMDMHTMTFPDNAFHVVYSAHSLEHALDAPQVVREIVRVLRSGGTCVVEVPVRYRATTQSQADLVDFETLDALHAAFAPYVAAVLFAEERPARSERNTHGTPIARTIFHIKKA